MKFASALCHVVADMSPYLLFGFFAAGLLSVLVSSEWIERHLGRAGLASVLKASLLGVPLPLCSCGVIPVAASLRRHGASRGATTAFVISTPQTGVDSILVTLSLLGPVLAVFRPLAAFVTGVVGGQMVTLLGGPAEGPAEPRPRCDDACSSDEHEAGWLRRAMAYGFVALPRDIGRALLVGVVIAGLLSAVVPDDCFAGAVGSGIGMMLVMMLLGLPVYVCATASVPVAAALISKGISPGAALVFLMTGPATNAAAIATMWRLLGKRATVVYLSVVGLGALACGLLLDQIVAPGAPGAVQPMRHVLPVWLKAASAVALVAVLALALWPRRRAARDRREPGEAPDSAILQINGMTCSHCEGSVQRALAACADVTSVAVDRDARVATVTGVHLDHSVLRRAVEAAGFEVVCP